MDKVVILTTVIGAEMLLSRYDFKLCKPFVIQRTHTYQNPRAQPAAPDIMVPKGNWDQTRCHFTTTRNIKHDPVNLAINVNCERTSVPQRQKSCFKKMEACKKEKMHKLKKDTEKEKHRKGIFPVRVQGTACRRKHRGACVGVRMRPTQHQP